MDVKAREDAPLKSRAPSHSAALGLTALAMLAFAGNSLLCRYALKSTGIDPAAFTAVRIVAGAAMLALMVLIGHAARGRAGALRSQLWQGNLLSGLALFVYAAAFSFAYTTLTAATGALLLFGAVQATMIGYGLVRGERLHGLRLAGCLLTFAGLIALLLPGLAAPPFTGCLLMLSAGAAWGIYSLRGKGAADPVAVTAGNFAWASLPALALGLGSAQHNAWPMAGIVVAVISGALTSGLGYVVWYIALRALKATEAAIVQLSVPVIAAAGGVLLLGEALTLRLALCALAILGGIALVVVRGKQ